MQVMLIAESIITSQAFMFKIKIPLIHKDQFFLLMIRIEQFVK